MNFFLNLFFILLPWQTRWIFSSGIHNGLPWEWGTFAVTVVEAVVWLAFIWSLRRSETTEAIHAKAFWSGLLRSRWSLAMTAIVTTIFVFVAVRSTPIAFFHLFDGIVLFLILRTHPNPRRFIPWFLAGMIPAAALGIVQFLTQHAAGSTILGLAEHVPWQAGTSVVETGVGRWLRAYGPFPHPNIFGGYLAVALVLAVRRPDWTRFLAPLFAIALVLTFSRSAWLAAGVGIVAIILNGAKRSGESPWRSFTSFRMTGLVVVAAAITALLVLPLIRTRATAVGRLETLSLTTRAASWRAAADDIRRHPLFGIGLGHGADRGEPVHNAPALALQEIGLISLMGLIGLIALAFRRRALDAPLLAALIVLALFDHYLWSLLPGIWLGWSGAAFSMRQ